MIPHPGNQPFRKVLIANRGEIAHRLILACRELGLANVVVYADPDQDSPAVWLADEAHRLAGATPRETYLDAERVLAVAKACGADAIHPGYGFLSEHPGFAKACAAAGVTFVGPPAAAIARMGHKLEARRAVAAAGVPVLPGDTLEGGARPQASDFPLMVKAAGGGGGIGLRRVELPEDLEGAIAEARAQFLGAFGAEATPDLYWERYLAGARHVEVQVAGDVSGNLTHLGERECSIQRRYQKVIEESPSAALDEPAREMLGALAVRAASAVGYHNVGTVEFLYHPETGPVFLEMNTRLQVEHPVTELVTGVDLAVLQLRLAAGEALADALPAVERRGHAIEARLYAEDPLTGAGAPGRIDHLRWPTGPWVRVDAGVEAGVTLSPFFDALIAKIVVWGPDRATACRRLADALARTEIAGSLTTNLALLRAVAASEDFRAGRMDTGFLAGHGLGLPEVGIEEAALAGFYGMTGAKVAEVAEVNSWARRRWR